MWGAQGGVPAVLQSGLCPEAACLLGDARGTQDGHWLVTSLTSTERAPLPPEGVRLRRGHPKAELDFLMGLPRDLGSPPPGQLRERVAGPL